MGLLGHRRTPRLSRRTGAESPAGRALAGVEGRTGEPPGRGFDALPPGGTLGGTGRRRAARIVHRTGRARLSADVPRTRGERGWIGASGSHTRTLGQGEETLAERAAEVGAREAACLSRGAGRSARKPTRALAAAFGAHGRRLRTLTPWVAKAILGHTAGVARWARERTPGAAGAARTRPGQDRGGHGHGAGLATERHRVAAPEGTQGEEGRYPACPQGPAAPPPSASRPRSVRTRRA